MSPHLLPIDQGLRIQKDEFMSRIGSIQRLESIPVLLFLLLSAGCGPGTQGNGVVATTTLAADLASTLLPPTVSVVSIMGTGVDPHTFEARSGTIRQLHTAKLVVHHGLHLEGRLSELLAGLQKRSPDRVCCLADPILAEHQHLLRREGDEIDPHIWFSPRLWSLTIPEFSRKLAETYPEHAETIFQNARLARQSLDQLDRELRETLSVVPEGSRVLVTSHDAFGYWGMEYGFEVLPIQGISTATEVAESSLRKLAEIIRGRKIPAGFVESSVSPRTIEKLRQMLGNQVFELGGELYSDSLGAPGTAEANYAGMLRHNAALMAKALGKPKP